ncbi:hypothetical protein [Phascolarctobacterium sp.]|uniref:hypothetical protein n=1 Tax=Phascolarctobacterium sp. TaxID=2049039 RepID=UPI00386F0BB6
MTTERAKYLVSISKYEWRVRAEIERLKFEIKKAKVLCKSPVRLFWEHPVRQYKFQLMLAKRELARIAAGSPYAWEKKKK